MNDYIEGGGVEYDPLMRVEAVIVLLCAAPGAVRGGEVAISEVMYNPGGGSGLEYVELHNPGSLPVDLRGWSFTDGIDFAFGGPAVLPPQGFLVVARRREAAISFYGIDPSLVVGDYRGTLENGGERLALVDGRGRLVEELEYDDRFPFEEAAGEGLQSLQRTCFEAPGQAPFNFRSGTPTPGRRGPVLACPPAPRPIDPEILPVILNEIHYHPPGSPDPPLEYLEIHNRSGVERDLSLWKLDRGVQFVFPPGTRMPPGGYLVVAQDPAALIARFGLDPARVLGPFLEGSTLSNSGEAVRLVDRSGTLEDQVRYGEAGAWPAFADGLGGSLQRVDPRGPSNAPGNWRVGAPPSGLPSGSDWITFRTEGVHDGPRIYLYLLGAGEALVDGIRLEVVDGDGLNYIANGDFTEGFSSWSGTGNHVPSQALLEGGHGDNGACGLIKAAGPGNGFQNGVRQVLAALPPKGVRCALQVRIKPLSGEGRFVVRSSIATADNGVLYLDGDARTGETAGVSLTPLKANSPGVPATPATLELVGSYPPWPTSRDPVTVVARAAAVDVAEVAALYQVGAGPELEAPLLDDGRSPDARAGDGLWSGYLPTAPNRSLVWFSFRARTAGGTVSLWPPFKNPAPQVGYHVADDLPPMNEEVRLFYIFTPGALNDLSCADGVYQKGTLVDFRGRAHREVGVKFRGETACGYPKRPMRVEFSRGDYLDGQEHLNFNAGWNDKSMLREEFAFDFFREAGVAQSEAYLARVHTNNGAFHGAYFTVEDPSEGYLRRNLRDPGGGLYKSRSAMLSSDTGGYEPRSDSGNARLAQVRAFATDLNRLSGQPLIEFLDSQLDVEGVMDYHAVKVVIIDGDSVVKNWLLYLGRHELSDSSADRVSCFPWDLDLSYGQMLLTTDVRNYDVHPLFQTQTYPFHDQGYHGIYNALLQRAPGDHYLKAYYGRMWRLLEEKFRPEVLYPRLDRYEELTADVVLQDLRKWPRTWGSRGTDPAFWRRDHRTFIQKRRDFLATYLTAENPTTLGRRFRYVPAPRLKFSEVHYRPPAGGEELEFVEVSNLEDRPVLLEGWTIPLLGFAFPEGASIDARATAVVAKDPPALRGAGAPPGAAIFGPYPRELPDGGGILRLLDRGDGPLGEEGRYYPETIDVVVYEDRSPWPRGADGAGKSLELVGLDLDNDRAASWRSGWSPGTAAPRNLAPRAALEASPPGGPAPLTVLLSGLSSSDPEGDELYYRWDLPGGASDGRAALLHTFEAAGTFRIGLSVSDPHGGEHRSELEVVVGGQALFRRGDATADGEVDLSDPVATLNALFLGGSAPSCPDAADSNDDRAVDIADPVFVLNYLFLGGSSPPAPGPDSCGEDPTPDPLPPCLPEGAGCP